MDRRLGGAARGQQVLRRFTVNWGAIALGAMAGLGSGLVLFLVLSVPGAVGPDQSAIPLILLQFLSLVLAGFITGVFVSEGAVLHGGLAGLMLFLVVAAISIAIASGPNIVELALLGVVAAVLGSSGGALAESRRRET